MRDDASSKASSASFLSSASGFFQDDVVTTKDNFQLSKNSKTVLAVLIGCFTIMFVVGVLRSAWMLADAIEQTAALGSTRTEINNVELVQDFSDLCSQEGLARIKYFTSGRSAEMYLEVLNAQNNLDTQSATYTHEYQAMYFAVPEYRRYKCSFARIRSNSNSRPEAVALFNHRTQDESKIDPWDDQDFFECLVIWLADLETYLVVTAKGFDPFWQSAVAFHLAHRSLLELYGLINYSYLTRELILNKGSVTFVRERDRQNINDALGTALFMTQRATEMTDPSLSKSAGLALDTLQSISDAFFDTQNASKAWLIVSRENFEPTTTMTLAVNHLQTAQQDFLNNMLDVHESLTAEIYSTIGGEATKLFIFLFILPTLAYVSISHVKGETIRMQDRFDATTVNYFQACKAIYRLLPESIAKKLNNGTEAAPEYFHNVTILHSDIVGFRAICNKLRAFEVVSMLDRINGTFDRLTQLHHCIKVDTMLEAHVAACGIPVRIPSHCSDISFLALALVEEVGLIKIPNTNRHINIRIGIHSGPVCAGIVGIKMLRYCLFGNTLQYAHQMEESSKPQKVQLSLTSYQELDKLGGFLTAERPREEWPDEVPSFWLTGHITNSIPLALFSSVNDNTRFAKVVLGI